MPATGTMEKQRERERERKMQKIQRTRSYNGLSRPNGEEERDGVEERKRAEETTESLVVKGTKTAITRGLLLYQRLICVVLLARLLSTDFIIPVFVL